MGKCQGLLFKNIVFIYIYIYIPLRRLIHPRRGSVIVSEWSYREAKQRLRKNGTAVLPPSLLHLWREEGYAALAHRIDGRTCRPVANRMSVGWCCCGENASDGGGAWVEGNGSPPLEEEDPKPSWWRRSQVARCE